ncbi:MAG: LysR family transcriptional regulator [Reyranella sp.]|jgi:DNA-binding transcriptional LysR family regulator|nr:LysR family transcriptional regulator [Reyranella sp.]MBL6651865.1 LysR family transcriptional regulator [Reyranella sp.]
MARALNLRQVEAFKAVIESGTVSRAAGVLHISQPAVSKLLAHLEQQTGLGLFERVKGRLVPSQQGMRLYQEIDRIFVGVRQVESAVESIRREGQGRLNIGVMPGLSGAFIRRVTMAFLQSHPEVYISVHVRSSQLIADWLTSRQLDVALIRSRLDNPYVDTESLMEHPLVCVMPPHHRLARRKVVTPRDLDGEPFVSFASDSYTGEQIATMFDTHKVKSDVVLDATVAPTVCEFVASGLGVSLIHPLFVDGLGGRLAMRRFEPALPFDFLMCRARNSRNVGLVDAFAAEMRAVAGAMSRELTRSVRRRA